MPKISFSRAEGVEEFVGANEVGLFDERGAGEDLFVEFVLGEDGWGFGSGVDDGDGSFFGGEVDAAGGGKREIIKEILQSGFCAGK
jgi:hypothetical protein